LSQRLNSFFSSNQELRQISGKVRQLRAFQSHYEQVAPPSLLRSSHVAQIEDKVLILAANNSAVAAKLRQLAPELIRQLELQGCEVTGIQVRVQVTLPPTTHIAHPSSLSEQGKQQLSNLAATLSDSPLKSALERLARYKKGSK
jgi:hypothetical protein